MNNRFTVKDFFYVIIGLTICFLIWMNIVKTNREVTAINSVNTALRDQNATLGTLTDAIEGMQSKGGLDADTAAALIEAIRSNTNSANSEASRNANNDTHEITPRTIKPRTTNATTPINLSSQPSFIPGYNIKQSVYTYGQNLKGLPQQWQTAPDDELPSDFETGDTLIIAWKADAKLLTPLVSKDAYASRIHYYTHEYLTHFNLDAPFNYTPGLAKSWEVTETEKGMVVVFELFENARWSDGKPVTADDVIFTFDTTLNEKIDTVHLRGYLNKLGSYEKLGDHSVRFEFKEKYFDIISALSNLTIIPKHVYGDFDEETFNEGIIDLCVGSGPYKLDNWVKNDRIELVRNENYWGAKPPVERITFRIIPEDLPMFQEFKAGNVDLIPPTAEQWTENVDAEWFKESGSQPYLYFSPRGGYNYIGYNLRLPVFADKRTRQALTMLIDRQAIIDTIAEGMGALISGPFFFKSEQYNKEVEPWPYDPERARQQLKEVGWEDTNNDGIIDMDLDGDGERDPFEITYLLPSGGAIGGKIQRFVQDAFRQAGIKLNLDQLEWTVFNERLQTRNFDMVTLSWTGSPEGDPFQIWHSKSEPDKGSNAVGFINQRADELIERGRETLDHDKRMEIWHEFHKLINEEQPYTFLYAKPKRAFLHARFKNAKQRDYRLYYSEWYVPQHDQIR